MDSQDLLGSVEKRKKEPLLQQLQGAVCHQVQGPKDYGLRRSNISRPLSFSKRSLNISRQSFASDIPESELLKSPNVTTYIHSLAYLSFGSLIYAVLVFYVLNVYLDLQESLKSSVKTDTRTDDNSGDYNENRSHRAPPGASASLNSRDIKLCRAGVGLSCYMLAACLFSFFICSMQNMLAAKIMKVQEGEDRAVKFLDDCSLSRILAVSGFFSCVPVSFVDLAIFLCLQGLVNDNLVGVLFMSMGAGLCLVGGVHSCYRWREERLRAQHGMPVYDSQLSVPANLASYAAAPCHHLV